jgi:hypothetical protein
MFSVAPPDGFTQKKCLKSLKTEISSFFKSVMNEKKYWDGETRISASGYQDILQDVD